MYSLMNFDACVHPWHMYVPMKPQSSYYITLKSFLVSLYSLSLPVPLPQVSTNLNYFTRKSKIF